MHSSLQGATQKGGSCFICSKVTLTCSNKVQLASQAGFSSSFAQELSSCLPFLLERQEIQKDWVKEGRWHPSPHHHDRWGCLLKSWLEMQFVSVEARSKDIFCTRYFIPFLHPHPLTQSLVCFLHAGWVLLKPFCVFARDREGNHEDFALNHAMNQVQDGDCVICTVLQQGTNFKARFEECIFLDTCSSGIEEVQYSSLSWATSYASSKVFTLNE